MVCDTAGIGGIALPDIMILSTTVGLASDKGCSRTEGLDGILGRVLEAKGCRESLCAFLFGGGP